MKWAKNRVKIQWMRKDRNKKGEYCTLNYHRTFHTCTSTMLWFRILSTSRIIRLQVNGKSRLKEWERWVGNEDELECKQWVKEKKKKKKDQIGLLWKEWWGGRMMMVRGNMHARFNTNMLSVIRRALTWQLKAVSMVRMIIIQPWWRRPVHHEIRHPMTWRGCSIVLGGEPCCRWKRRRRRRRADATGRARDNRGTSWSWWSNHVWRCRHTEAADSSSGFANSLQCTITVETRSSLTVGKLCRDLTPSQAFGYTFTNHSILILGEPVAWFAISFAAM